MLNALAYYDFIMPTWHNLKLEKSYSVESRLKQSKEMSKVFLDQKPSL